MTIHFYFLFHLNFLNRKCGIGKPMKKQFSMVFAFHSLSGKMVFTWSFNHHMYLRLDKLKRTRKIELKEKWAKAFLLYKIWTQSIEKAKDFNWISAATYTHSCMTLFPKRKVFNFKKLPFCANFFTRHSIVVRFFSVSTCHWLVSASCKASFFSIVFLVLFTYDSMRLIIVMDKIASKWCYTHMFLVQFYESLILLYFSKADNK